MCRHLTHVAIAADTPPLATRCESQIGRRSPLQPFDARRCLNPALNREIYSRISRRAMPADVVFEHDVCDEHYERGSKFHYACGVTGLRPIEG